MSREYYISRFLGGSRPQWRDCIIRDNDTDAQRAATYIRATAEALRQGVDNILRRTSDSQLQQCRIVLCAVLRDLANIDCEDIATAVQRSKTTVRTFLKIYDQQYAEDADFRDYTDKVINHVKQAIQQ